MPVIVDEGPERTLEIEGDLEGEVIAQPLDEAGEPDGEPREVPVWRAFPHVGS